MKNSFATRLVCLLCLMLVRAYSLVGPHHDGARCFSTIQQKHNRMSISIQLWVAHDDDIVSETNSLNSNQELEERVQRIGRRNKNSNSTDNNDDNDSTFQQTIQNAKFLERNKHWVVLVDDEEAIRLAVGDYLYDQGYQVTACADADAFLEIFHNMDDGESAALRIPDAIVSDVRMPGKDGLELLNMIRADVRLGRVPVILLTAKGMTADRIAGYKAGANVYLPKPFAPEELLSILDNSIQRRKQMTTGQKGSLVDLKQEMAQIKEIMKRNGQQVVQKTNVYLTLVEREVLELICKGYTNKEIAAQRGVNIMGVNKMIQKLYKETKTETRTELVRWAYKTGYVSKR